MKYSLRIKLWLLMRIADMTWFIEKVYWFCLLCGGIFILVPLAVIERLAILFVMHICKIEPRLPITAILTFKWMRYCGGRIPGHDKPDEDSDGYSFDEWVDKLEERVRNSYTRW